MFYQSVLLQVLQLGEEIEDYDIIPLIAGIHEIIDLSLELVCCRSVLPFT